MILLDLNELALKAKEQCDQYDKKEFVFSQNFKSKFKELLPDYDIEFLKYTSLVRTKANNLLIIVPNQWFVIGSFFSDYVENLRKYKEISETLKITDAQIKSFRDEKEIDENTLSKIDSYLPDADNAINFKNFLTNYSWWFGSKTIDRSDYFVSPVLNLSGVVNVTQTYIADLAWILSLHKDLVEILKQDYNSLPKKVISKSTLQKVFYGAPGTGKSHKIEIILGDVPDDQKERITFHPEYDYSCFIGGYKPYSDSTGAIQYKFVPQVFTKIYIEAWKNTSKDYYLAIEEINRGNCAEIFGDLFQLLDRNSNYSISPAKELREYIEQKLTSANEIEGILNGKMKLPPNLHILASMNTSDQSLFPMDSAFKRRWSWEYVPINYEPKNEDDSRNESYDYIVKINDKQSFKWIDFIKNVNSIIKSNRNLGSDKCIGNYFIKPESNEISFEEFINKAIFYLWIDVFKDEEESIFSAIDENISYEDFFPIKSKGVENITKLLSEEILNVEINEIITEEVAEVIE